MRHKHGFFLAALLVAAAAGLTVRFYSIMAIRFSGSSLRHLAAAAKLNPVNPEIKRRLGSAWIQAGQTEAGIECLKRSLKADPFRSETWLELAGAHLTDPVQRERHFEQGIAELRTAARLGPGRPELSLRVATELLRLWPLLDKDGQKECRERLIRGIVYMKPEQVDAMVRDWYRYSRSWDLLAGVLERCPDACDRVSARLLELGAPLEWRWRLLDASEKRRYAQIRSRYADMERYGMDIPNLERMIDDLDTIRGYSRLLDSENMDWVRYRNFREVLLFKVMEQSLRNFERTPQDVSMPEILAQVERLIAQTRIVDLADFPRRLSDLGVLKSDHSRDRIMQIRLDLRVGDHAGALENAQQLLPVLQTGQVVEVGLMAVRAAIAVRLMTMALRQVEDLLKRDPANIEVRWRWVQIKRFLREDVSENDLEVLQNASLLRISRNGAAAGKIPLVEDVRAGIDVPEGPFGGRRLLQVYLNHAILLEKYLDDSEQIVWLDLPVPTELDEMPMVEAKVVEVKTYSEK